MKIELGFGTGVQTAEIPEANLMGILTPNEVPRGDTGEAEVRRALAEPIGSRPLREIVKPGEKIAVVTSDITRPMPTYTVMPALLDELYAAGVKPEDITLVFALGSHRGQTDEERRHLAGERAWSEIRCVDGDVNDVTHLGTTTRGTPVDIVRTVAEADRRICLGNIEYHYFAGYSGGAKAIMPGVSTRAAIQSNHSRMVEAAACAGKLAGNPVREDIEEAAAICGVDFIVNVVLDAHKTIVKAVAGDVTQAHRAGCRFLDTLYRKDIDVRADIVLVSQGGAPKDLNLYQTQKALDNARHAVRKGGIVILVGSCREGLGEGVFEKWMTQSPSPEAMIERIGRDFQLGGHKAAAIAMVLRDADVYLVSELDAAFVSKIFLRPFSTVQEALDRAFEKLGAGAQVLVMPYGGSTLPHVREQGVEQLEKKGN
jgi:nickel-dependent lactate racemase